MRSVRLRRTSDADADLLTAWLSSPDVYRGWGGAPVPRETVVAKYTGRRAPDVECFLVLVEDTPVAFVQEVDDGEERAIDMFVAPGQQRRGFGGATVEAVAAEARRVGKCLLSVDPRPSNEGGVAFWRALGFQDDGPPTPADAIRMVLRLTAE